MQERTGRPQAINGHNKSKMRNGYGEISKKDKASKLKLHTYELLHTFNQQRIII